MQQHYSKSGYIVLYYFVCSRPNTTRAKYPKNLNMILATLLDLNSVTINFNVFRI